MGDADQTDGALPERVRRSAADVAARASLVRVDEHALDRLVAAHHWSEPEPFPEEAWSGPEEHVVAGVLWWNAVNFGSGWFPLVAKRPGLSGARSLATNWQRWVGAHGMPAAGALSEIDRSRVAEVFGQDADGPATELLDFFARAWRETARLVLEEFGGNPAALVEDAGRSAATLAETLGALPTWRDEHRWRGTQVPLYKRAQIVASQLAATLHGNGLGAFDDLDRLTCFADNLVPHVLRHHGVLDVDGGLASRIDRGDLLQSGEPGEVELRASAVHAVEVLVQRLRERDETVTPARIDHLLWQRGQDPAIKARPRHRCRCSFY